MTVEGFIYRGTVVNIGKSILIQTDYREYFVYRDILKNKKFRHLTKMCLCRTELRVVHDRQRGEEIEKV